MSGIEGMGGRVHAARLELGLTQHKLAAMAKMPQSSLSAVERGVRGLTAWHASALAKALGCTVAWLQTGVDESPLCAEIAAVPVADIKRLIAVARKVGFNATADTVETWLKESVGDFIPF